MQPKFNGICNLAEVTLATHVPRKEIILHHSRGGQLFETLEHLDRWIIEMNPPAPLHGELYVHGWSLQKIGAYAKKIKPDQHLLEFWVYDMAQLNVPFIERFGWVQLHVTKLMMDYPECPIQVAPTVLVNSYEEAKQWHDAWVAEGYEGGMLKNKEGLYMFQYNSNDIEKVKEFLDDEFEIIGGKAGTGTDEDCIIYRCITKEGKEFDARPRGSVEDRKQMLINLPNDIGKKLTIRFAEWSEDGVPLQPVGIPEAEAVRDYE
jgi:DNA ligase-1